MATFFPMATLEKNFAVDADYQAETMTLVCIYILLRHTALITMPLFLI